MKYTAEQFERLPKWAQSEITRLSADNERLSKAMAALDTGSQIYWEGAGLEKISLPERAAVNFVLENGTIECTLRGGELKINASGHYTNQMMVLPKYANGITVKIEK